MDSTDGQWRSNTLELCFRLHNLRIKCVGIGETQNVYLPTWWGDDDELWFEFEHLMFSDIWHCDHVARFHAIDTYEH